jgi:protein involved in polysaccharide export with SLBB domain
MNRNSKFKFQDSTRSARSRVRAVLALLVIAMLLLAGCKSKGPEPVVVETLSQIPRDDYVYTISPGDQIQVDIQQDKEYAWKTEVLPDGRAVFKYAGEIDCIGLTLKKLREKLGEGLKEYYTNPVMILQLSRVKGPDPIVFLGAWGGGTGAGLGSGGGSGGGQSQNAHVVPYRKGLGVTEAIALAGGPSEPDIDIAPYVYIVRDIKTLKRTVYRYDLALAVRGGTPDLPLHPGDVVFIDNSWLQDLGRALGIVSGVVNTATAGVSSALLVDVLSDGAFGR